MNYNIIVARRPSGQISFISMNNKNNFLKPGWEYVEIDRLLIPKNITHAKLWDYLQNKHKDNIKVYKGEDPTISMEVVHLRTNQRQRLKDLRNRRLKDLDAEWLKAQEINDRSKMRAIHKLKEDLRSMKDDLDTIDDPQDIIKHFPPVLSASLQYQSWDAYNIFLWILIAIVNTINLFNLFRMLQFLW